MAEKEQEHRHEMDRKFLRVVASAQTLGLVAAFLLAAIGFLGSFYLLSKGLSLQGAGTFVASLAGLIGTAIYMRRAKTVTHDDESEEDE